MLDLGGFVPLVRFQYCFCCQTHCKQVTPVCKCFVATLKGGCVIYFWVSLSRLFFVVVLSSGSILLNCCHFLETNTLLVTKLEAEVPLTELCECQVAPVAGT